MLIGSLFTWWYGAGMKRRFSDFGVGLAQAVDFWSLKTLVKTLFSPFKLISSGSAPNASMDVQLRVWADRQFSRCFGAFVRTIMIIVGLVMVFLKFVLGIVGICLHLAVPLLPVAGLVMFAMEISLPWSLPWPM